MSHTKKILLLCCVIMATTSTLLWYKQSQTHTEPSLPPQEQANTVKVTVGTAIFNAILADTKEKQRVGLSHHQQLLPNQGMLFPFTPTQSATFWMKDMQMPIDLIWIRDSRVIGIEKNLPIPETISTTPLPTWASPAPIDAVLEISAGSITKLGITIGDPVIWQRQ